MNVVHIHTCGQNSHTHELHKILVHINFRKIKYINLKYRWDTKILIKKELNLKPTSLFVYDICPCVCTCVHIYRERGQRSTFDIFHGCSLSLKAELLIQIDQLAGSSEIQLSLFPRFWCMSLCPVFPLMLEVQFAWRTLYWDISQAKAN